MIYYDILSARRKGALSVCLGLFGVQPACTTTRPKDRWTMQPHAARDKFVHIYKSAAIRVDNLTAQGRC